MSGIPQRQSLVTQTVAYLKAELKRGTWNEWLPGERTLCHQLQVSRNTLRAALRQLATEGLVRSEHGLGCRIIGAAPRSADSRSRTVCLLAPEPLDQLRPTQTLWIDELRALLIEHECRLQVVHGQHYFRAKPGAALQRLVRQQRHGCWILMRSSAGTQAWFERSGENCVVAGSCYPGVNLPTVDLDYRALCRHAAGILLGLGHRRIALLAERTHRPGDIASEEGFNEGARSSAQRQAEAMIVWHEPTVPSVCAALNRLLSAPTPPTALLIANPYFYLTVTSRLAQLGVRVPQDISVVSRDEDMFLSFLVPPPARYTIRASVFARRLLRPVLELIDNGVVTTRTHTIMPEFVRGESVAAPK